MNFLVRLADRILGTEKRAQLKSDLSELERYRSALWTADRWLAGDQKAEALCRWIKRRAEGDPLNESICDFRKRYREIDATEEPAK